MSLIQECRDTYGTPKVVAASSWEEINTKRYEAMLLYKQGINNNLVFTELLNCDYKYGGILNTCMLTAIVVILNSAYAEHAYFKAQEPTVDEVQEVVMRFLHQIKTGEYSNNGITAWCVTAIKWHVNKMLRDRFREVSRNVDLCNYSYIVDIDEVNPDEVLDETNLDPAVLYELAQEEEVLKECLSPRQLEAVELREDGFTESEIAVKLDISKETVNKQLDRSRHKLAALRASYKLKGATNVI